MIELQREPLRPLARPALEPFRSAWRKQRAFLPGEALNRKMTAGTIVLLGVVLVPVAIAETGSVATRQRSEGSDHRQISRLTAASSDRYSRTLIFRVTGRAIPGRILVVPITMRKVAY